MLNIANLFNRKIKLEDGTEFTKNYITGIVNLKDG
jgi:hypothetical protein